MAQIGGLYSFCKMVFGSIINSVQYKMMLIDVINKYNHRLVKDSIKRKKVKQLEKSLHNQNKRINLNNPHEDSKIHDGGEEEDLSEVQNQQNNRGSGDYIRKDLEENLSKWDSKRHNFEYNCSDLLYQSICCFKSKPTKESTSEQSLDSRHDQFIRDFNKLNKEIDIINMVSNIKHLKHAIIGMSKKRNIFYALISYPRFFI